MANIDNVQLPDGSSYNIVDNTSGFATQNYVDSAVSSVTKTTIGLGNVDNTSDLNKPISTAAQAALDTLDEDKADKTDIATVESGTTASRAYTVGELVYVSGTLYRVKTAIASGATFTPGTNVEVTNISNVIGNKGSVSVTADGTKTYAQLLADLYNLLNRNKISAYAVFSLGGLSFYQLRSISSVDVTFSGCHATPTGMGVDRIHVGNSTSYSHFYASSVSGSNPATLSNSTLDSSVPNSGTVMTIYY